MNNDGNDDSETTTIINNNITLGPPAVLLNSATQLTIEGFIDSIPFHPIYLKISPQGTIDTCLLYTSDAADE